MPTWGELLTEQQRWTDVRFVKESFVDGKPAKTSVMGDGSVPAQYVRTDRGIFEGEIATIDPARGKPLYEKYCATCHGDKGLGDGPGTTTLASGGPAPLPKDMSNQYLFYRIREGAKDTMMYSFKPLLDETQIWDLTAYVTNLTGGKWGE
jgi:mono/diheme cytochrome c family protein